mmetsp:Transcript_4161/g.6067  ORF Transcript_4161/g.6067 Transcript_4161/m.6067 type:complete len:96 (-) Transcript_4161:147-434(-)
MKDGKSDGKSDGESDGTKDGPKEGRAEGAEEEWTDGADESIISCWSWAGKIDGVEVGTSVVGRTEGCIEGTAESKGVGPAEGDSVGGNGMPKAAT